MCVVLELYKFIHIVIIAIPSYILLVTHVIENTTVIFNCIYICILIIHNTGIAVPYTEILKGGSSLT